MQRAQRRPGRPPGSTGDATRANILRSARICFASKGFGVATNGDIAARAGVTSAAIYQYFDSKLALYVTTAREAMVEVATRMRARAAGDESAAATLSGMVTTLLAVHEADPSLAAFLSALPSELQRHPEIARSLPFEQTDVPAIMGGVVERAVVSGELEAKDAGRVGEMFIACMMGLSQYAALHGRGRPAATAFAELLEGGLFWRVPAAGKNSGQSAGDARPVRSRRVAKKKPRSRTY